MNRILQTSITLCCLCILIGSVGIIGCQTESSSRQDASNQMDSVSYALGMDIARFYQKQDVPINPALVHQGINDIMNQETTLFSEEEALAVLGKFRELQAQKEKVNRAKMSTENLAQSQMFFRNNQEKEGVIALASGLQYKVLQSGKGSSPKLANVVRVAYTGKLLNGTVFDSSDNQEGPTEIKVADALPGWTEALLLMKPGDKWELFIPPDLAYGEEGFQGVIPPNSVLIYEVELSEILP